METYNARITATSLGYLDRGILTIWIHLEFDAGGQGFGGFVLDDKPLEQDRSKPGYTRQPSTLAGRSVAGILEALQVETWEKLVGTYVRVRKENWSAPISHIGHIIKDRWFSFVEAAETDKAARDQLVVDIAKTIAPAKIIGLPEDAIALLTRIANATKSRRHITEADLIRAQDLLLAYGEGAEEAA